MKNDISSLKRSDGADPKQLGLAPYGQCPLKTPSACKFSDEPEVIEGPVPGPFPTCSVYRCQACGHGVSRPALSDVSALYAGRESQDYQGGDGTIATRIKQLVFLRQTRKLMRQVAFRGGMIVDFACGSGVFTNAIAQAAPKGSTVYALDFFEEPPKLLKYASYKSFNEASAISCAADLVTCFHAVEHDDDPHSFVQRLVGLMGENATLVIEVPNANCKWRRVFGSYWDNWYLPYHRVHFTKKSLRALVENAGLFVTSEHPIHVPVMGRSIARLFAKSNSLPFIILAAILHPLQWIGEVITGESSAIRIIARNS